MQCTSSIPKKRNAAKAKWYHLHQKKDIGVQRILATKYHESGAEKRQQQQHKHNNNSKGPENIAEHSSSTAQHSTADQSSAANHSTGAHSSKQAEQRNSKQHRNSKKAEVGE